MTTPMPQPGMAETETAPYSPSAMLGSEPIPPGPSPEQMRQQVLMNAVQQVRSVEQAVMDIASQFPSAAQDARSVVAGLRSMLKRIVAQPGGQEPVAPRMTG